MYATVTTLGLQACVSLHNFLVIQRGHGYQELAEAATGYEPIVGSQPGDAGAAIPAGGSAAAWRDQIASEMHQQYQQYLAARAADQVDLAEAQDHQQHASTILSTNALSQQFQSLVQRLS